MRELALKAGSPCEYQERVFHPNGLWEIRGCSGTVYRRASEIRGTGGAA